MPREGDKSAVGRQIRGHPQPRRPPQRGTRSGYNEHSAAPSHHTALRCVRVPEDDVRRPGTVSTADTRSWVSLNLFANGSPNVGPRKWSIMKRRESIRKQGKHSTQNTRGANGNVTTQLSPVCVALNVHPARWRSATNIYCKLLKWWWLWNRTIPFRREFRARSKTDPLPVTESDPVYWSSWELLTNMQHCGGCDFTFTRASGRIHSIALFCMRVRACAG